MSRHDGDATGKESLEWLSKGYQTLAKVEIETVDFPRVNSKAELERQKGLTPKVCDLPHIPETPENGETREFNWIDTFETPNPLRHISESEKRQKEPGMGVSVDAKVRTYTSDCPLCEWKSRKFKKQSLASMAYLQHRQEHGMGGF
jgi:hypothetical protein